MLWLSVFLPKFPLDVLANGQNDTPIAIMEGQGNRQLIYVSNAAAEREGIHAGMPVSAAQALCRNLEILPRDQEAEHRALDQLALWAMQFTPAVSLMPGKGLLLEVGGSLKLFRGFQPILQKIGHDLQAMGHAFQLASAPTARGAWWLSRHGGERHVHRLADMEAALAPLPLSLIARTAAEAEVFATLGIRELGECLTLPRDGLARRFGQEWVDRLDQALGRLADIRAFYTPPIRFEQSLELPAPVQDTEALLFAARRLLVTLSGFLLGYGRGVQHFTLELLHDAPPHEEITVGLMTPSRESPHLINLLRERLDRVQLAAPVMGIRLVAENPELLGSRNLSLFSDPATAQDNWAILMERLRARLGQQAVYGVQPHPDHRPEHAWANCPPGRAEAESTHPQGRPLWLLPTPRPLRLLRNRPYLDGPLMLKSGPERIESGWWDGAPVARDYYLAETTRGARLWIFREHAEPGKWFVHGIAS